MGYINCDHVDDLSALREELGELMDECALIRERGEAVETAAEHILFVVEYLEGLLRDVTYDSRGVARAKERLRKALRSD